jgi:hypothetical protein
MLFCEAMTFVATNVDLHCKLITVVCVGKMTRDVVRNCVCFIGVKVSTIFVDT